MYISEIKKKQYAFKKNYEIIYLLRMGLQEVLKYSKR